MEQQDHIATLCAAGTVGIAATGLALGIQTGGSNGYPATPGKRKWPGATSMKSAPTTQSEGLPRRTVSQPLTAATPLVENRPKSSKSSSLLQSQSKRDFGSTIASESDVAGSRASSTNRSDLLRPGTADARPNSERRDPSTSSSWLKRLSTVSSPRASSPSARSSMLDSKPHSIASLENVYRDQLPPNKLVKRSTSQRALSTDQAKGIFLRRPATSHQRSATVNEWAALETSLSTPATPYLSSDGGSAWRPFFERRYPRKRHAATDPVENPDLRTITPSSMQQPILVLASQVESDPANDMAEKPFEIPQDLRTMSTGRQRLKRSLSSVHRAARRRHFTDPTVKVTVEAVNGTISTAVKTPLSPSVLTSPFHVGSATRTPSFDSSPPIAPIRHRFSLRKRRSMTQSDPAVVTSDNDNRVFTDDDSMDFQSDTAYDSLTTRATVSSHSGLRTPKLDTVFDQSQAFSTQEADATLANLVQKAKLTDSIIDSRIDEPSDQQLPIHLTEIDEEKDDMDFEADLAAAVTPVRSRCSLHEDYNRTPIQHRLRYFENPVKSSPPDIASTTLNTATGMPEFVVQQSYIDEEDQDEIDWSPQSDTKDKKSTGTLRQCSEACVSTSSSSVDHSLQLSEDASVNDESTNMSDASKRLSSIFDWSEHQKVSGDIIGSMLVRPRTVHGKQGPDGLRSRSSARKGAPQMHMRSQSVPNNRDTNAEPAPNSTSKFGTWGLGHKPVSEEWSDDFEFDDVDEEGSPNVLSDTLSPSNKGTRGVRVPKSIMDRQASVHIQFGQVQEFMLLVEELKSLRARGAALQLLETHSKQLWEDAESIIDLATINNGEDDNVVTLDSPTPSDIFTDEALAASRTGLRKTVHDESGKSPIALRSVSSPATPPSGRPRGESLAQAKTFLQSIHQSRSGCDSSPAGFEDASQKKLPFDTQDLKDLVSRSGVITRALKEVVRKAEGLNLSPQRTPPKSYDPAFSQIFNAPDSSPCPPFYKPGLPKSRSANSYLLEKYGHNSNSVTAPPTPTALIL